MNKQVKPMFSESVLEDLKLKYPYGLRILEIYPDEDAKDPLKYIVKKPSKSLVYLLSSKEYEGNMQASSEVMLSNCVLAGDMEALEQDASVFSELVSRIGEMMKSARSELKKV
ncbi:hypothetical protein PG630_10690 [Riemerella anatipestifer]|nr:hypothetical protein [Riemerella anatipestifer]